MRYTHSINAVKSQEWGLNLAQGALMDLLNQAGSWADPQIVGDKVYYWVSRNKIVAEIPLAYQKPDTAYRALKLLAKKELIVYIKDGKKDLIALTDKGKTWNVKGTAIGDAMLGNKSDEIANSEIDPSKFGNISELNSEIDPTNKNTNTHKNISNKKRDKSAPEKLAATQDQIDKAAKYGFNLELQIESFLANGKSKGLNYECWSSAFTLWLNREVSLRSAVPVEQKRFDITKENWNNPNAEPTYQQPTYQQSNNDVYHPSHSTSNQDQAPVIAADPNWHWKDPLPNMSIPETEQYIKANKRKGENNNKAYQRFYAELGGAL